ncbi:antitoxin VapB family protein [Natronococcus sp. A-GB7]|uniref:antitoxin VapB family protein n=1 Tax=Natronococcus sp. A-GB7 TaxID=3037649 RepID=UPI00241DFAAF|nr:antitoxin VapB family protein [Natronococcus sp. A-GB7]MDG5820979.1 antitoxin VapB family protein [Natronococcus sp. A-GB7]
MEETEYRIVRLTEEAYQCLERCRRESESLSDVVKRVADGRSLLDLAGSLSEAEAERMRDTIDERNARSRERLADRVDP